jgi:adenylate kinase
MRLIFLGPPGVGKGTQAALFCNERGYQHISTGELLREAVKKETELGTRARGFMDAGDLVPDAVILGLIEEALDRAPDGAVFDGFPRNQIQAEDLDGVLRERGETVNRVILFRVAEDEIVRRLTARGRADDTPETVKHRLNVYEENTAPLVDYYHRRGVLSEVDGMGAIPEIQRRVAAAVNGG